MVHSYNHDRASSGAADTPTNTYLYRNSISGPCTYILSHLFQAWFIPTTTIALLPEPLMLLRQHDPPLLLPTPIYIKLYFRSLELNRN